MRLGISQACYRWLIYPHLRRDRPDHGRLGHPPAYLQGNDPPNPEAATEHWLLDRCIELNLNALYVESLWQNDSSRTAAFRARTETENLRYVGSVGLNVAADEEEWWGGEFDRVVRRIEWVAAAGGTLAAAVHSEPGRFNHFSNDPPIERQIRRAVHNFSSLVQSCQAHSVVLAIENHMDYRLSELAQVVEEVSSPWVRINLDTANSIAVVEDPIKGARRAASYAVAAHLKDLRVQPATGTGEPRVFWAPLGRGDVPIAEILALLEAETADPGNLPVCVEVAPPPDHDPHRWIRSSLDWLLTECGGYFKDAGSP